jgi:RNA polymerase sigma factor (sigma-70 family)
LGLKAQDRGDLEQELFRRLAHRLPKFDPARSPLTCYARLALDSDAANILRERRARKRYGGHVRSLDYDLGRGDFDVSLDRRTNRSASDDLRHAELALDVAELLARLSPEDREAVRAVAEFSKTRAAARLGVTRARLDARLEALRRRLVRFSREFG